MERVLGLVDVGEYTENDPWGRTVLVNQRVVLKTLRNPPRTPAVAWLKFAIRNAIELWGKPVEVEGGKKELRRYYLCPINKPQKYAVAVIVGEDGVVFNVIDCDGPYAQNLRSGNLLEIAYNDDRKFCLSHDCCDDIVAMETALARAENERKVAIKVGREVKKRLGMKNPPG